MGALNERAGRSSGRRGGWGCGDWSAPAGQRLRRAGDAASGERPSRRRSRAQSLIIFALSFTVLLGFAGISVDALRAFDLYGKMQRAAEAGALAGVLYVPTYYNTVRPGDVDSAVSRASKEVVKNGFGTVLSPTTPASTACPTSGSVEVAVCLSTTKNNDLQVIITERLNLVLLGALGLGPTTLVATAQADYLPLVTLGSRENYFGDEVECSPSNPPDPSNATSCALGASGNHLQYFMATMNGPAELKEMGDPMVYCAEGPGTATAVDPSSNSYTAYNGYATNHPQYSSSAGAIQQHCGPPTSTNPGNPDQQPSGYAGPATQGTAHPGGYNYEIVVPSSGASLWVFNPTFIPTTNNYLSGSPSSGLDLFFNQLVGKYPSMQDPFGNGIPAINAAGNYDAPPFFFTMTYTLYSVSSLYDRSSDTIVGSSHAYPPYDAVSADLSTHGCGSGQVYDPYNNGGNTTNAYHGTITAGTGCFSLATGSAGSASPSQTGAPAPCWLAWCKIQDNLAAGTYRLVVEATGLSSNVTEYHSGKTSGLGTHYYALKVCPTSSMTTPVGCTSGASSSNPGVSISAWNNMEVNFTTPLSQSTANSSNPATSCVASNGTPYTCVDLACIPAAYAGRTLTLGLYDPGDGSGGNIYIGVVPPAGSGATATYPSWVSKSTIDGDSVVQAHFTSPTSYNQLNGLWFNTTITLPANYSGTCTPSGTGWWQLVYASNNGGQPVDWVGVSFALAGGSPVHLVPPN